MNQLAVGSVGNIAFTWAQSASTFSSARLADLRDPRRKPQFRPLPIRIFPMTVALGPQQAQMVVV
jgi:hypothetical protein